MNETEDSPEAAAFHVRAVANADGTEAAERTAAAACARHPTAPELHYLRAVLLVGLGHHDEAAAETRRVLYLDPSLAVAQLLLGGLLRRRGDLPGARRAYRAAAMQLTDVPADAQVPLGEGERAGALARLARDQLALLDAEVHP
jgi:chemotaxis protein methyltransferase CheR